MRETIIQIVETGTDSGQQQSNQIWVQRVSIIG